MAISRLGVLLSALLAAGSPCMAAKTQEPGRTTVWDQIMQAQAARGLYLGSMMLERKRYQDAVKEFAKAVLHDPADPTAHRMLGVAYYWTGQVEQAEAEFRESLRLDPSSAQTHLLIGIVHAWKGDTRDSYESFKQAAKLDPERADIQMNLGSVEETMGMLTEALAHFRRAVALDPEHPLYHFQLGMLYRRLGRDEEAADALKTSLKKFPGYQDALLELGATYERMGKGEDALDMFARAVRLKPRDSVARLRLARVLVASGSVAKAREVLKNVFHLTPSEPGGALALSVSYGRSQGARPSGAPSSGPAEDPNDPLGMVARNLARIPAGQEAVLAVDVAFLPKPKLVKAKQGEAPSSLKRALERAGKLPPASVLGARREYSFTAADPRTREEEIRKAVADLRSVMAKAPADSDVRLGMNLRFSDAPASAPAKGPPPKVSYQPRDVGNDMGLWVMGTGWMALVEEILPEAETGTDSASRLLDGIGLAVLGHGKRALEAFDAATAADPKDELAWLGRGVSLVILGDEKGAAEAYRRALALDPKNKTAAEGLKWLEREPSVR